MLIGYVSDERYAALPDVLIEFTSPHGSWETRSRASGSVFCDLPPGEYTATLYKPGYGAKRSRIDRGQPALPVSPAVRRPTRLRLAQARPPGETCRVPRPFGRAVSSGAMAPTAGRRSG